jgi:hypothetical protein
MGTYKKMLRVNKFELNTNSNTFFGSGIRRLLVKNVIMKNICILRIKGN